MERLYRTGTKSSPEIDFSPETGVLRVTGQSYPENTSGFYQDIFVWLKDYLAVTGHRIVVEINISYMNTSSTKCLMDMVYMLEDAFNGGSDICVNWYYSTKNRSMRECGEEFGEELSLEFNLIPLESSR
ncbi:DUF1987 domain-containing protein [Methylomusa anaerophila]|uniref:SiaC family regulatory phosphoprotein domain-containing protein n=1 Tax=Methylomusa anaerophila TaxID=1930071 RepID=A0A348AR17_9FIRM|nr:DUF1987 domain-containing protein [Methylomusa anaerophila]BBB93515.1 hypothetical protein MAMMFC1_04232 [Methylomusa anaerophila]